MSSEAIDFLLSVPMFQQIGAGALNPSLDKITEIDRRLDSPHKSFKIIHVGGTNGKGSVSHMIASVLMSAGYRVGLYTSPHLKRFTERIRVDGKEIEESFVDDFVCRTRDIMNEQTPSFFEITTALAFDYFRAQKVDYAVIEVGLGGVFDATNIVMPELSVITNISKDHTAILGNTLHEIAKQKAGIIKQNVPVIVGESNLEYDDVFVLKSRECGSELIFADKLYSLVGSSLYRDYRRFEIKNKGKIRIFDCELRGEAQKKNILTVLAVIDKLNITDDVISDGLRNCVPRTSLMGRWQTLCCEPLTICDTAHNEAGIKEVVAQLRELSYKKLYFIIGMVSDKDISTVLSLLPKDAYYLFTHASVARALSETELAQKADAESLKGDAFCSVIEAITKAKELAGKDDVIFIGGSNFTVADALEYKW